MHAFITVRIRGFRKGNVFSDVCLSVCSQRGARVNKYEQVHKVGKWRVVGRLEVSVKCPYRRVGEGVPCGKRM